MTGECAICFALVAADDPRVVVTDMPLVGGRGVHVAHLRCYTIRALCAGPAAAARHEWPRAPVVADAHPPDDVACSLCRHHVGRADCLFYAMCSHQWVHFECVSFFDFTRRAACPFCPILRANAAAPARTAESETYVADADKFSPVGSLEDAAFSLEPVSATGEVDTNREWSNAMTTNAVAPLMNKADFSMHQIEVAFATRRPFFMEPSYPTVARQLTFEYWIDASTSPATHVRVPHHWLLGKLSAVRCTLGDLFKLGATLPILLRDRRDAMCMVDDVLRAGVLSKDTLPFRVTYEILVRAGVPVAAFAAAPRTYLDLVLIDFSMPVFLAAGGTARELRTMTLEMAADPVSLLEQFGMSTSMKAHLMACFGAAKH